MPRIEIVTTVDAPVERVFDLCRSVDAHIATATGTDEMVVGGVTSGLLKPGDEVTFEARHFGIRQVLTSRITEYDRPLHFRDSMVSGIFARFDHDHHFVERDHVTEVLDVFDYRSPWGALGWFADRLLVTRHMTDFLRRRMRAMKEIAESDRWTGFLPEQPQSDLDA